jgi:phage FluMu protein Com
MSNKKYIPEKCPKCRNTKVFETKEGNDVVLICENCKFKEKKK